ncbi:hypothetical protein K469DRAFT_760317 [Zopfia rhizophila CBS 207.26]|uniref:FAD/NAD(P)-binding domain-containing protein n=1 Tax=Zopfia rhizophila CBS 207.26 TaxID=1314779 RepID=A0A6A6DDY3_9PEZI|nr:hypothetical protein K469DRAFT_760317 [Zopfia rhizophila CBS 207.26]
MTVLNDISRHDHGIEMDGATLHGPGRAVHTNATNATKQSHGTQRDPYSGLLNQWHSQPTTVRVIHLGASATGLCAAYKMRNKIQTYELVRYEKNDSIRADLVQEYVPRMCVGCYSPGILECLKKFYRDQNLSEFVKLEHRVVAARWHEDKGQWEVEVEHNGQTMTDWCHILMNGSELLNKWRSSVAYSNKRVAVLGTGSTSIQTVPQVQKVTSQVKCFLISPTWIAPPVPRVSVEAPTPEYPIPEEISNSLVRQYFYKEHEIKHLETNPDPHLYYRKQIEITEASHLVEYYMKSEMIKRLGNHSELVEKLIPSWPVACRRLTTGDGNLEALIKPTVSCNFLEIESIDKSGLTTTDGQHHEVDVRSPLPQYYLGIGAPGFPNYWVMNGPRRNLGNGTVLPCFEVQIEYVIEAAKKIQTERIRAMDIRGDITDKLNEYVDKWMETSVFCCHYKSWYENNTVDRKAMCSGGSLIRFSIHYLKTLKMPRWGHHNIRYSDDDPWSFLGNGRIKAEVEDNFEGMPPYIRNSDHPWEIM